MSVSRLARSPMRTMPSSAAASSSKCESMRIETYSPGWAGSSIRFVNPLMSPTAIPFLDVCRDRIDDLRRQPIGRVRLLLQLYVDDFLAVLLADLEDPPVLALAQLVHRE